VSAVSLETIDGLRHADAATAAELKAMVGRETVRICREHLGDSIRVVILTGSMARNEAIFVHSQTGYQVLGDAEFLIVLNDGIPLPSAKVAEALSARIQISFADENLVCPVSLSHCHAAYLRGLRPNIFSFELRECGEVISGQTGALSSIPRFSVSDIPLEDGWRLVCNRIVEQLALAAELTGTTDSLPISVYVQTMKLYLDMASSLLLFAGHFAPTYRRREELLRNLVTTDATAWPFPINPFARLVTQVTQWRVGESKTPPPPTFEFWETAVFHARCLWKWELSRLSGLDTSASEPELMRGWMQCQSCLERLRGWAYLLREEGFVGGWQDWPRRLRLALISSPRYLIYSAASGMLWRAPSLISSGEETGSQTDLWHQLPSRGMNRDSERPTWRNTSREILWNYKKYLVGTRS